MDISKIYGVLLVLIVMIESTLSATSNVADSHQDEELEVQLASLPQIQSHWKESSSRGFRRPVPTRSGASPGGFKPSGFRNPVNTGTGGRDNGFRGSDNGFRGSGNGFRDTNGFRGSDNGGFRGTESGFRNSENSTTTNNGGFRSS